MPDQDPFGRDFVVDELLQQSIDEEGCGSMFAVLREPVAALSSQGSLTDLPMSDLIHCIALQSGEKLEDSIFCECGSFFGAIHAEISRQDGTENERVAEAA